MTMIKESTITRLRAERQKMPLLEHKVAVEDAHNVLDDMSYLQLRWFAIESEHRNRGSVCEAALENALVSELVKHREELWANCSLNFDLFWDEFAGAMDALYYEVFPKE